MGNGNSRVGGCFAPFGNGKEGVELEFLEPLDEGLGHSFCYVRPVIADSPAMTPSNSERFTIDSTIFDSETCSGSFGQDQINLPEDHRAGKIAFPETTFKTISGASVSANASTARTGGNQFNLLAAGDHQAVEPAASFDCTASFTAVPLQPAPHGSGPLDGFMSGPLEKGGGAFMSGPLDGVDRSNFSAPLYYSGRRPTGLRRLVKSAISSRRWVRRLFLHQSAPPMANGGADAGPSTENEYGSAGNLQWAHGKAGEDRVHVVLSEEQGWLFVGIYDGFSGPDAPDFLMAHLYRAIDRELQGLLWDFEDAAEDDLEKIPGDAPRSDPPLTDLEIEDNPGHDGEAGCGKEDAGAEPCSSSSRLSGQGRRSRRLYELLQMELIEEQNAAMASARSGSGRGPDAPPQEKEESAAAAEQSMGEKKLKTKEKKKKKKNLRKKFFPWSYDWHRERQQRQQPQPGDDGRETAAPPGSSSAAVRRCKAGPADPGAVLAALRRALEATEVAFMEMVEKALDRNPELALMGSCVLVMLMKDQDVYAMNLGDSRVVLAQERPGAQRLNLHAGGAAASQSLLRVELDRISEESPMRNPNGHACKINKNSELSLYRLKLRAVQLTTDHSTDVEEEVFRIRGEHADDAQAVFNGRVKGQLKVTRALGAGFLKRADMNEALLEMFRIEYVGAAPYVSCSPSMAHHRLSPGDRFLVLSSDGLYQYFSNEEVVSHVAWFMDNVPDGDPAQYLIAELLFRAAKKNGMDFHALLDIPQGDRRKYHDDVSVMVVSLEGRIWRSSG